MEKRNFRKYKLFLIDIFYIINNYIRKLVVVNMFLNADIIYLINLIYHLFFLFPF